MSRIHWIKVDLERRPDPAPEPQRGARLIDLRAQVKTDIDSYTAHRTVPLDDFESMAGMMFDHMKEVLFEAIKKRENA